MTSSRRDAVEKACYLFTNVISSIYRNIIVVRYSAAFNASLTLRASKYVIFAMISSVSNDSHRDRVQLISGRTDNNEVARLFKDKIRKT